MKTAAESRLKNFRRWHAKREQSLDLLSIDDATWEALAAIRQDFAKARANNDDEAQLLLIDYGAEVLAGIPQPDEAEQDWVDGAAFVPGTDLASSRAEAERDRFFRRYAQAKAASGLKTQRQVAAAAGLSPTTVHAIEAGMIRPQFRTVEKLAAALGIPVTDLLGSSPAPHAATTANNGHTLALPRDAKRKVSEPPNRRRIVRASAKKRPA